MSDSAAEQQQQQDRAAPSPPPSSWSKNAATTAAAERMKGNGFGDRARQLTEWFQAWNSCEQTIALYSLLSKVSAVQARFLSLVLEHSLKNGYDSKELTRLEKLANDATFLSSLHSQTEEQALALLLTHLPLLHPGNTDARKEYMRLLPKVLLGSSKTQKYLDQCRQLLSLALVHPAFPQEDRDALTFWLNKLDGKHKPGSVVTRQIASLPLPVTPASQTSLTPPPSSSSSSTSASPHKKIRQIKNEESSSTLGNGDLMIDGYIGTVSNGFCDSTPPSSHQAHYMHMQEVEKRVTLPPNLTAHDMLQMGKAIHHKSTTLPARTPHYSIPGEDLSYVEWSVGMKDVPPWLKSLRLHKYAQLFAPLTYEDMLGITEEYLEKNNVTQGARKKIVLSICRLVKRPETLLEIEQDMEKHGRLLHCIQEIRQMLQTPIKPYTKPEMAEGEREREGESKKKMAASRSPRRQETRIKDGLLEEEDEEEEEEERKFGRDGACSGDEDGGNEDSSGEEGSGSPGQHSSSDPGSDLDELLTRDFPTEDLPSLISRAMGKAYNQLMLHTDTNEDNLSAFIKLLDSALQHEAFTLDQKKLFFEWKQQCQQVLRVITPKKPRSARTWGAFTIAGMPSSQLNRGNRGPTRSLRQVRNGGGLLKSIPGLPSSSRNSSTLPRMTPRNTGPPLPVHTFRPSSTVYPTPAPSGPTQMNAHSAPFIPSSQQPLSSFTHLPHTPHSAVSSISSHPHKHCDQTSFDHLAEGVAEYILNDPSET